MNVGKLVKWGASTLRVAAAKVRLGSRLRLPRGGKPVYLGRGVRLMVEPGGVLELGEGCYIDDRSRLQVQGGARMRLAPFVYLNTNVRMVAAESVTVGEHTLMGPNVCVFDHDHAFDAQGVHADVKTAPIAIGSHCWLGANAMVTRGVSVGDRILIGGGASLCVPSHNQVSTWAIRRGWRTPTPMRLIPKQRVKKSRSTTLSDATSRSARFGRSFA